jgi:hypothetical protein
VVRVVCSVWFDWFGIQCVDYTTVYSGCSGV